MEEFTFILGIGDEVVLFVGFLVLSAVFLILVGLWPRSGARERNSEVTSSPVDGREDESGTPNRAPSATVSRETETEGTLRHRSTGFSTEEAHDSPSSRDNDERRQGPVEETDFNRQNDVFTIRIVKAGSPDQPLEVQVTNSTTVNQIRE